MTPREQFLVSAEICALGIPDDLTVNEAMAVIARLSATFRCTLIELGGEPSAAQRIVSKAAQNAAATARPRRSSPVLRVI